MKENKLTIVFQAYGSEGILAEALYSLISLYKQDPEGNTFQPIMYTDQPNYFLQWNFPGLKCEVLTPLLIQEYRGEIQFVHRVKVCVLMEVCNKYSGNILYLDTDTVLLSGLEKLNTLISEGKRLMHVNEGELKKRHNPIFKKIWKFTRKFKVEQLGEYNGIIAEETCMYNAGVLGFNTQDHNILQKVLILTDQLYAAYPKHIMEQLAFSYLFSRSGEVIATDKEIYHYWMNKGFREELIPLIQQAQNVEKLQALFLQVDPRNYAPQKKVSVWKKIGQLFK